MAAALKGTVVWSLLKRLSLDPKVLDNYNSVANISFLGKGIERVVADLLQTCMDNV